MMKRLVLLCTLLSGCGLYWGGNGNREDDDCNVAASEPVRSRGPRDP